MKNILPSMALLSLFGCVLPAAKPAVCANSIADVRRLERSWLDAYENHDAEAMQAILEDNFIITHVDASMQSKRDVVESVKGPRPDPRTTYRTEDVYGRCYGDTVILTGWVVDRQGSPSRYTDTYVRTGGRWSVVASHLSHPRASSN